MKITTFIKTILIVCIVSIPNITLKAQELNVNVQMITAQVQNVDKKVFESLKSSIVDFMNNTKWTNDQYKNEEKIQATILITISQAISQTDFQASIQVESNRPVYKSAYNTPLLNYSDKDFKFKYVEFQPFEFNENNYTNNLTSVLAFYAYMVIGLDYDSYSLGGGAPYFQKAQAIVNNGANGGETGWKASESNKNRYWMVEQMLNPAYKPLRECFYKYHIKGLDVMQRDVEAGRKSIMEALELIKVVYKDFPTLFAMQLFFNAKQTEIINIFSQAKDDEKSKVIELMSTIDPANGTKYQNILKR